MRWRALACDYDGTIATAGTCAEETIVALRSVAASGRRLLLVTGRTRMELAWVFSEIDIFDAIVLENGGVVLHADGTETLLGPPVPPGLVGGLLAAGMDPLIAGRVICSGHWESAPLMRRVAADLRADMHLARNRSTAMLTPPGISKATGLAAALHLLGETLETCVAVGDGENDADLLGSAGASVAVANAVDTLKARADAVLELPDGVGIRTLVASLVEDDLSSLLGSGRLR